MVALLFYMKTSLLIIALLTQITSVTTIRVTDPLEQLDRRYWPIEIAALPTTTHTHVTILGKVTLVKTEADGDTHIKVEDARGHFLVAECIPKLPCEAPKVGDVVLIKGISREDKTHKWYEVHPVEELMDNPSEDDLPPFFRGGHK